MDDITGSEWYMDRWDCTDISEDSEDDEFGSGLRYVYINLAHERDGDYILHDYEDADGEGCIYLSRPGRWWTTGIDIVDLAGNSASYDMDELKERGWFSSFWVFSESSVADLAPFKLRKPYKGTQTGRPSDLAADDDSHVGMTSAGGAKQTVDWAAIFQKVPNGVENLTVTFKGKSSAPCLNRISIYNQAKGTWETLDEREIGTDEVLIPDLAPDAEFYNLRWYISRKFGPGQVVVRATCTAAEPFTTSTDVLTIDWAA